MNPIKDQHLRPMKDIRISVIDQCNFRCSYCMPAEIFDSNYPFLQKEQYLSFSEIIKVVQAVTGLGVEKVRLTGGEPLLRKDLHLLVQALHKQTDIKDIALTTNGVYLPKYANLLKKAGLQRVNVSMDAIEDNVFKRMNGRSVGIKPVLNGIEAAQEAGLGVKINMVVQKGVNEHQIIPMASYFKERGIPLRFIEFMDVGSTNGWKLPSVVTKQEMIALLNQHFTIQSMEESYFGEVANRYKYVDNGAEVGIISSVTDSFCSTCTRA
ncbi:MAG TPA: GTP 3',8-cyclase MoaA, partial [Chondromyces sp.]|nr:GTP 3',8-cyclase MoaA [Chondromyces sp.]